MPSSTTARSHPGRMLTKSPGFSLFDEEQKIEVVAPFNANCAKILNCMKTSILRSYFESLLHDAAH